MKQNNITLVYHYSHLKQLIQSWTSSVSVSMCRVIRQLPRDKLDLSLLAQTTSTLIKFSFTNIQILCARWEYHCISESNIACVGFYFMVVKARKGFIIIWYAPCLNYFVKQPLQLICTYWNNCPWPLCLLPSNFILQEGII